MPKSAQVSGFDVAARNYKALVNEVVNLGGGDDDLNRLHTDRTLRRRVAELLVGQPAGDVFPLTIDYGQTLAELVMAGNYDYVNPNITSENFQVGTGEANVEAVLVHLGGNPSDDEVTREMERLGLRDGTMDEGLAFGEQYPEIQRKFPIVFRGSVWADPQGNRNVGCLWGSPGSRRLSLDGLSDGWGAYCRFLAVRK